MKKATVLKDISPEIKAGDTLILDESTGFYVKDGKEAEMVEHTMRYGLFKLKKRTVMSPNHYVKSQVENMPEWFRVEREERSEVKTLICTSSTKNTKKGTSYEGRLLKFNHGSGKYEPVHSIKEAEMFQVLRADNGKTIRVNVNRFVEPSIYPNS